MSKPMQRLNVLIGVPGSPIPLRLTALPATSLLVPARPQPSLFELARQAPGPRSSPPIPAETQHSAIISPSFDSLIDQS